MLSMRALALALLPLCAAACSPGTGRPEPLKVSSVEFRGEHKGANTEKVKPVLSEGLAGLPDVERAYLLDVKYPEGKGAAVMLLIAAPEESSTKVQDTLTPKLAPFMNEGAWIDLIVTKDADLLKKAAAAGKPFYTRKPTK